MDEAAFQQLRAERIIFPCAFAKALLIRCADCSRCRRLNLAEREAVTCTEQKASETCQGILAEIYQRARFALKLVALPASEYLPHTKKLKLECGSLLALDALLGGGRQDVYHLLAQAQARFGEALPYDAMMRAIVHYKVRGK